MNEMCDDPDPQKIHLSPPHKDPWWAMPLTAAVILAAIGAGVFLERTYHIVGH